MPTGDILSHMLDTIEEAVFHTDLDRTIVAWNEASRRLSGHAAAEVVGRRCQDRVLRHVDPSGRELCESAHCPLWAALRDDRPYQTEIYVHHQDGHLIPVTVRTSVRRDASGKPAGISLVAWPRSVEPSGRRATDWREAALTDTLTGLGNRRAFLQAWSRARRALKSKGTSFGVLLVDIDRFKNVNDSYGHAVGDKVLRMVGRTLAASVRHHDSVIRWGGEEFLLLLTQANEATLAELAERVRQLVQKGWVPLADRVHVGVTVSVGGALVDRTDLTRQAVIEAADRRLFACKEAGRNRCLTEDR